MSLSQSHGRKGVEGWTQPRMIRSESRPRILQSPDNHPDEDTRMATAPSSPVGTRPTTVPTFPTSPHGNAKPQEPSYARLMGGTSKKPHGDVMHDHHRPWTSSPQLGKKENPHVANMQHPTWIQDCSRQGRWNKERKDAYYAKQDSELMSMKPADEKFAHGANMKYWTHLAKNGTKRGGLEKLVYVHGCCTKKNGLYAGKFSNVQHKQVILGKQDWEIDTRAHFDNRLMDDVIRTNDENDRAQYSASYDVFRPKHTRSCPRMGADFMQR